MRPVWLQLMVWRISSSSNSPPGRIFPLNPMLSWRISNLSGYELIKTLRVESGGKRKRRGGVLYLLQIKKILALNCVLKAQGKTFVILSKVFKLNGIHLSKGLRSIILLVNEMEYTAVKGLIFDIIAMFFRCFSRMMPCL